MEVERGKYKMFIKEKTIDALLRLAINDDNIMNVVPYDYNLLELLLDENVKIEDFKGGVYEDDILNNYEYKLDAKIDIARDILKALQQELRYLDASLYEDASHYEE